MRILLTRAAGDTDRTCAKLEAAGHGVLLAPVIEIVPTDAAWPAGTFDAILATSVHAFEALPASQPSPELRRLIPLYLVGGRTAEAATAHGFAGAAHVEATATDLAHAMTREAGRNRRVLYLAGRDRKPGLESALAESGQTIHVLETYRAEPVSKLNSDVDAALRRGAVDAVLHFSRRSAELFLRLTEQAGLDPRPARHLCLSEDVAEPLRQAGCGSTDVAEAPNEAALLAMVSAA